jgi:class 3 adenylate cyclase
MQPYKIGRSRSCDIVLSDESISREHARITSQGNGSYELTDSGSTHGTFIDKDGQWVRIEGPVTVTRDDAVMFGRHQTTMRELLVNVDDAETEPDADSIPDRATGRRRLAAIVAMDVVGYSAKMGEDETRTLAVMREVRTGVVDPCLEAFHGRLFKEIGDGLMIDFVSVNDAVMFAVEVQRLMLQRNGREPEHRHMVFRIGINVGDVILEGDDVFGEGVNIAARLEGIAPPGGICLSSVVRELIKSKLDLGYKDMGDQRLKNISEPVRVYALGGTGEAKGKKKKKKGLLPI